MSEKQKRQIRLDCMHALRDGKRSLNEVSILIERSLKVTRSALIQLERDGFVHHNLKTGKFSRTTPSRSK